MFLVAVGFWNFLGAGIFGFLINLPVVSYYEIGTALTANHGHAAMMGVYGMLAIGLAMFCLRYLIPADKWPEKWARIAFWSTNIGLAGCASPRCSARHPAALQSVERRLLRGARARVPDQRHERAARVAAAPRRHRLHRRRGDPTLYIAYLGVRDTVKRVTLEEPEDILFTEVTAPEGSRDERRRGGRRAG